MSASSGSNPPADARTGGAFVVAPPPNRPRSRLVVQSVVVMLAITACCLFAGLIAARNPVYVDATATRSHRLSPRTVETLSRLSGPTELVVTINSAAVDARSAERTRDVLDAFARASDRLSVTVVDVASARGGAMLDEVWGRVQQRSGDELARQRAALAAASAQEGDLAARLEQLAATLVGSANAVSETEANGPAIRGFLEQSASFCRLGAKDLRDSVERSGELLKGSIGRSPVPPFDVAASALRRAVPTISSQLAEIASSLDAGLKRAEIAEGIKDRLRPLVREVASARDLVARTEQALSGAGRSTLVNVARVLERSSAALVIGPPAGRDGRGATTARDLAAVDIEALFPSRTDEDAGAVRPDMRARTEELLGSAIASLVNPAAPIVVLMHGEERRLAPDFGPFQQTFERLRLRGIDIVEWPVWLDRELPSLAKINPRGERPVVYATVYTIPTTPQDAARYVALTHAIEGVVSGGKPALLSVNPSTTPGTGGVDAMVSLIEPLGVRVDSARPLLHQVGTPATPVVSPDTLMIPLGGTHPVSMAVNGRRLWLPWTVPMQAVDKAGAVVTPLLTVDADGKTWGESQWIEFRSVPADQRAFIRAQDQPKPDSQRDDTKGPWMAAAAVERKIGTETQRAIVMGSNGWFTDAVAEFSQVVNTARVRANPGNADLLEASIYWLAGQDQAIATAPQEEAAPVIPPLAPGTIIAIRWALVGGLPLLVLLAGAVWRLVRG